MSYKYRYCFIIEGLNRQTGSLEKIHTIEQDRNTGLDHEIYKLLRTICYSEYDKYTSVSVSIYRWDLRYPDDSLDYTLSHAFVGMFFFDLYDAYTHRAIIINRPDGTKIHWSVFNWKD